jgi:hypothetical protein
MNGSKILGAFILLAIFAGLFWATAHQLGGWLKAVAVWSGAFVLAGLILLGLHLLIRGGS